MKTAAQQLIDTIDATGGIIAYNDGTFAPVGEPDWIDLGDTYLTAGTAIGKARGEA